MAHQQVGKRAFTARMLLAEPWALPAQTAAPLFTPTADLRDKWYNVRMKTKSVACSAAFAMAVWSCAASAAVDADGKVEASGSAFAPAVTGSSALVLGVNFEREQAFRAIDNIIGRLLKLPEADKQEIGEMRRKLETYKRDPWSEAPPEACSFLEECGLRNVYPRWCVLSIEGPLRIVDEKPNLGGMALAIAADVDLERLITRAKAKMEETGDGQVAVREVSVGGEKAWQVLPKDDDVAKAMREANAKPHLSSLDGKLLLVAMSRRVLESQIRLYRNGKGKGDALGGFSAADGELLRLHVSGIGDIVQEALPLDAVRDAPKGLFAEMSSIGEEIVAGLQSLSADVKVSQDGTVGLNMCLEAATEDDAELVRTLVGAIAVLAKTMVSRSPEVPKETVRAIKSLHVGGIGNMVELRWDDAMPILGGSMFPAIATAKSSANLTEMSINGRNLFIAITQASTEREAAGLGSAWPRTVVDDAADKSDIAGMACRKSTDYFRILFDLSNCGTEKWAPYVDCNKDVLGKDLDLWCVAANVTDEMPDCIPVLISANFNPELLPAKWDGSSGSTVRLPIGPAHGAAKSLFGDKAIVVVRKGGSVQVIKAKHLTFASLYGMQAFDLTNAKTPVVYLTPRGIAVPAAH